MPGRQSCFCHSQNPSEMAAGSSTESGRVHVAHGWCPAHKEAVLCFRVALCGAQLALGKMPRRQDFYPTRRHGESLHGKRQIFSFSPPWTGSSLKGLLLWSLGFLTSRFLQNGLFLESLISWGLISRAGDPYAMPVCTSRKRFWTHLPSVTCWR